MISPIIYLCVLAMLLSLLMLFFNKGYKKANRFLAGSIFITALYTLTLYIILYSQSAFWAGIFIATIPSCAFLVGPLSYFYVRSILTDSPRISKYDYLHFALFIVCFAGSIPLLFKSWEYKMLIADHIQHVDLNIESFNLNIFLGYRFNQGIRPFHVFFYILLQWRLIYRYFTDKSQHIHTRQWYIIKKWLLIYTGIFTACSITFTISILQGLLLQDAAEAKAIVYNLYLLCSGSFAVLIIALLFFPQIVYGLPLPFYAPVLEVEQDTDIASPQMPLTDSVLLTNDALPAEKIIPQTIYSAEYLQEIENKLKNYLTTRRYLQPDCTLTTLSEDTEIPAHHLTFYFNTVVATKFTNWRNYHRIAHCVAQIGQGDLQNMTLNAIANEAGFANQKTFINAFKQIKGCTPSEFAKQNIT